MAIEDVYIRNASAYAARHQLFLAERLGFGIHGIIHVLESNSKPGKTAIKVHRETEPYLRERDIYRRLEEGHVTEILGFHVPRLLGADDELRILEMTIVVRPFVLDFAGAYLDAPPDFPDETWAQWELEKSEQFDQRWPTVQSILSVLRGMGIYLVDISPSNIGFPD